MNAILYGRFSVEKRHEESITDQLRRCREFAAARGWTVRAEFSDAGISGAALGNRPGARAALEALETGDVLVVVDTTRLSRSQDLAPLVARLRHRGVRVVGVLDGYDSDAPTARMQAGLSGIMSEEFRASIASRTHSALDMRARQGRATGGRCYGYASSGDPVEAEADIVREIFRRAADGEPMRSIADDLNRRGVAPAGATWKRSERRNSRLWLVSAIHAILENERYLGRVVWNRSIWKRDPDSGVRKRIERPESDWVVTEGTPIVDRATFDRVRALGGPRKGFGGGRGGGARYLLSGLLVCGECGRRMIAVGSAGAHYACSTRKQAGSAACSNSIHVRREVAERAILDPIRAELLAPDAVERAVDAMRRLARADRVRSVDPAEVAEVDARIDRLERQIAAGTIERADVGPALAALVDRRRELLAAAWKGAPDRRAALDEKAAEAAYTAAVESLRETLEGSAPIAKAREALRALVGEIICRPAPDGVLVAYVGVDARPLLPAGMFWNGSGGARWTQEIRFATPSRAPSRAPEMPGPARSERPRRRRAGWST